MGWDISGVGSHIRKLIESLSGNKKKMKSDDIYAVCKESQVDGLPTIE